jgi:hypothetical protein
MYTAAQCLTCTAATKEELRRVDDATGAIVGSRDASARHHCNNAPRCFRNSQNRQSLTEGVPHLEGMLSPSAMDARTRRQAREKPLCDNLQPNHAYLYSASIRCVSSPRCCVRCGLGGIPCKVVVRILTTALCLVLHIGYHLDTVSFQPLLL